MKSICVGDLVTIAEHAAPPDSEHEDPRKKPGIVIDVKERGDVLPASIYVLWPGMADAESWFEDALSLLELPG